jgi:AraC-like DNA-binding protein
MPPKEYINEAKLSRSRTLIRNGDRTISEIASMLGFNSIHYFSRKFTHRFGITPSEFSRGIYDKEIVDKKPKKKKSKTR